MTPETDAKLNAEFVIQRSNETVKLARPVSIKFFGSVELALDAKQAYCVAQSIIIDDLEAQIAALKGERGSDEISETMRNAG